MASAVGEIVRSGASARRDPHAPRRRKRRTLALAAGLSETPPLIYTLQTLLR
jgi:hypothetical protein